MALTKISELTAASALDGTEMIPVVQSSTTVRATPAQIRTYLNSFFLQASNNLSDLANASTARTNLGLGSIATQAASSVAITGGSITGITDLAVADGGTGASTAADARTNLGLVAGGAGDVWVEKAGDTMTGDLIFSGAGLSIEADFSNSTISDRLLFRTSTVNGNTRLTLIPNGTSNIAGIDCYNSSSDPSNSSRITLAVRAADTIVNSSKDGTGTYLPLSFLTSDSPRLYITVSGDIAMGSTTDLVIDANRLFNLRQYTVATLPSAGGAGRLAAVTDATAPTYNAALVGGGAVNVPVYDTGAAWISH